jgi:hypothetical protein
MGNFLGASLISDQFARRRKNRRLKTEGVIPAPPLMRGFGGGAW